MADSSLRQGCGDAGEELDADLEVGGDTLRSRVGAPNESSRQASSRSGDSASTRRPERTSDCHIRCSARIGPDFIVGSTFTCINWANCFENAAPDIVRMQTRQPEPGGPAACVILVREALRMRPQRIRI